MTTSRTSTTLPATTRPGGWSRAAPSVRAEPRLGVTLLGGFAVRVDGREAVLPANAQRVLAGLSLGRRDVALPRTVLAERLWADSSVERALASLRTALWRIRQADEGLVDTTHDQLRLAHGVWVDVHESLEQAERLLADGPDLSDDDVRIDALVHSLLPGWEDDWLLLERERVRQIHLHALEALSVRLRRLGRHGRAIEAALAAVAVEPLRESAHTALIAAHLAEGNVAEAHRQYRRCAHLLWEELRMSPARAFEQLVREHHRP